MNKIILVVPCYNEERRFNNDYFNSILKSREIFLMFVNDGSNDNTQEILMKFREQNSNRVSILNLNNNQGKANAVRAGVLSAIKTDANYFGYLDADGAFPGYVVQESIEKVLSFDQKYDSFWFSRVMLAGSSIERKWYRHYIGRTIMTLLTFNLKNCPYDSQAGFKIFRNIEETRQIFFEPFRTSWLFDIEIFLRMQNDEKADRVKEIPVDSWKDIDGGKLRANQVFKVLAEMCNIFILRSRLN